MSPMVERLLCDLHTQNTVKTTCTGHRPGQHGWFLKFSMSGKYVCVCVCGWVCTCQPPELFVTTHQVKWC